MINWTHIMIHHSATKDSDTYSWSAIRRYHMTDPSHMWSDIGYHFGVELVGTSFEALIGRPLDRIGAHCPQGMMNRRAIGVCVVGNYDLIEPPAGALAVLSERVLTPLMQTFRIDPVNIVFHRNYNSAKSCPGVRFTKELLERYV